MDYQFKARFVEERSYISINVEITTQFATMIVYYILFYYF